MVKSNRKKRKIRKANIIRKRKGVWNCNGCGKSLRGALHHFFCNKCWKIQQAKKNET